MLNRHIRLFAFVILVTAEAWNYTAPAHSASLTWRVLTVDPQGPTRPVSYGVVITVAADTGGDLYVADSSRRIQKFSPQGRLLWTTVLKGPRQGPGPSSVAVDRWGNIYLTDAAIVKLSPTGRLVARWGSGRLANPVSVATGGRGNVFALYGTGLGARIEKLSPQGRLLATWYTPAGRAFYAAAPGALAVDSAGNLYGSMLATPYCYQLQCTPPAYFLVRKLSPGGKLIATWGGKDACCRELSIGGVVGNLAVDGQGNVYLAGLDPADQINHVEKLSPTGKILARWGEPGCGPVQFAGKLSVAVDGRGTIYVADWVLGQDGEPGLIHVLAPDGTPHSLWGTCPGTTAAAPSDVAVGVP